MPTLFNRNGNNRNGDQPASKTKHRPSVLKENAPAESELIAAPNGTSEEPTVPQNEERSGPLQLFSRTEVLRLLQVEADQLDTWTQIFRASLSEYTRGHSPRFGPDDISTLFFIGNLFDSGYTNDQVAGQLIERRAKLAEKEYADIEIVATDEVPKIPLENNVTFRERVPDYTPEPLPPLPDPSTLNGTANHQPAAPESTNNPLAESNPTGIASRQVSDLLTTVANSQQSVLNTQDSLRETIGVVVQDNFNLKHENRKLRERMLEIERTLAEQQRREETRKEIFEGRLRAVEGTLAAMQQQLAQLVQAQRSRPRRNSSRFW